MSRHRLSIAAAFVLLLVCACENESDSNHEPLDAGTVVDAGGEVFVTPEADISTAIDTADDPDLPPPSIWEQLDWQPIAEGGDPSTDCSEDDANCEADLIDMSVAVQDDELFVLVTFAEDFPVDTGSFEVFLFKHEPANTGLTVRHIPGAMRYWWAECEGGTSKHSGCHWSAQAAPAGLRYEWLDSRRFAFRAGLPEVGLPGETAARFGVAAAPFEVNITAEFTDRLPDELLVTATEVQGLAVVNW